MEDDLRARMTGMPAFAGVTVPVLVAGGIALHSTSLPAEDNSPEFILSVPPPIEQTDFESLMTQSPFVRTLDHSESLVLVGLAKIDGDLVATLRERATKKTRIVSARGNEDGWRVMGVEGDFTDPASVGARISVNDEVFTIRYDQQQITPPARPRWRTAIKLSSEDQKRVVEQARNFRRGISGDGYRGATPPALAEKMSRLSQEQREEIIARLTKMRREGVSSEDRQKAVNHMTDRALRSNR